MVRPPKAVGKFSEVPPLKKEPEIQGSSFTGGAEDFIRAFFKLCFTGRRLYSRMHIFKARRVLMASKPWSGGRRYRH